MRKEAVERMPEQEREGEKKEEKEKEKEKERTTAGDALRRVRAQRMLVGRLGERIRREMGDGVHSPRLDGVSGGHGMASGLEARLIKREALERLAARESALLREYERVARTFMDAMSPEDYAFCALYYLAGLSLTETAEALERSERQCLRYKRRIEEGCAGEDRKCHKMSACQAKEHVVR